MPKFKKIKYLLNFHRNFLEKHQIHLYKLLKKYLSLLL